jgi:hypothetical protein
LLQHKIDGKTVVPPTQAQLYATWPTFFYEHATSTARDVSPKGSHSGAQFSFIDIANRTADVRESPQDPPRTSVGFEVGLMATTARRGGRGFLPEAVKERDNSQWSLVVWDLLSTSFSRADFTLTKVGAYQQPRVLDVGDAALFADPAGAPAFLLESFFADTVQRAWDRTIASTEGPSIAIEELPQQPPDEGDFAGVDVQDPGGISILAIEIDRP